MADPIFLRLYVFTFLVPLRFPRETMFGLSLPPIVCRRAHVLYTLSVFIFSYWSGVFGVVFFTLLQMLPVYLDCPFCIAPSVFSSVCFHEYHLIPFDFRCTLSFFYTKKYVL